jgi:DNA-binding transcriptional ArsR family regulator/predicted N-acetyltransferase YhbS
VIRRALRPGDLGLIVAHHARRHANVDRGGIAFEGHVAASVARAALRGFPREREGIWIVEHAGTHAGSVALTDEGAGEARLRWISFAPAVQASGVGRRLVDEAIEAAYGLGYMRVTIETTPQLWAGAPAGDPRDQFDRDAVSPAATLEALIGRPRARILRLCDRARAVGELAQAIASVPSAATRHIAALVAAGLVARQRQGRHVFVRRTTRGTALLALYDGV